MEKMRASVLCSYQCYARGGGGGTTGWGRDFERPCCSPHVGSFSNLWTQMLAPGSGSLNSLKWKRTGFWYAGSLDTNVAPSCTKNSQKFELSSFNKMEERKEFNKPLFLFSIFMYSVSVNNYFVSVSKSYRISMLLLFILFSFFVTVGWSSAAVNLTVFVFFV